MQSRIPTVNIVLIWLKGPDKILISTNLSMCVKSGINNFTSHHCSFWGCYTEFQRWLHWFLEPMVKILTPVVSSNPQRFNFCFPTVQSVAVSSILSHLQLADWQLHATVAHHSQSTLPWAAVTARENIISITKLKTAASLRHSALDGT